MEKLDTEIMEWLNDHAILLGVVKSDGESEYVKVEGADMCFRDIAHMLFNEDKPVRKCKHCGCTDDRACPGGCSWVVIDGDKSVCSTCFEDGAK